MTTSLRYPGEPRGRSICRLGLATRGDNCFKPDDILHAMDRGINFLNWCGQADALSKTIAGLGARREEVVVCVQFEARSAAEAEVELERILTELQTPYVDVLTFYFVEASEEWQAISSPAGSLAFCKNAQRDGRVRLLGLTSHQRPLAAEIARSGAIDLLMVRYNAAHRGAETDVFPVTDARALPVVVYTCLRWGALLQSTPDDPLGFVVPSAPAWYQFALQSPSVTVALMSPANRTELAENLSVLQAPGRCRPANTKGWWRMAVESAGMPAAFHRRGK
ncbi:MAG TPA: aldo/keto reductase [Gemmataceae bacterium]|nr:aldo/keto reductase [Gemmataceae bacterium]